MAIGVPGKLLFLSGVAAFGLALFGFGKIVEEPERHRPAAPDRLEATLAPQRASGLKWELWRSFDESPARPLERSPEADAAIWATRAEWAPSD